MLNLVSEELWRDFVGTQDCTSLFLEKDYLNVTVAIYQLDIKYYLGSIKGDTIIAFYVFTDGNKIKSPNNFHQFWPVLKKDWKGDLPALLEGVFEELSQVYTYISLKTPIDYSLNHLPSFSISKRFTYLKTLSGSKHYSRNITRLVKKGVDRGYEVHFSDHSERSFELIWDSNRAFLSGKRKNELKNWLLALEESSSIKIFDLFLKDNLVASLLVIVDKAQRLFYTYLISIPDKVKYPEAQVMLYIHVLRYFEEKGFENCDFSGANIPSVAKFKSKFKGDLKFYYQIYYNSHPLLKIKDVLKAKLSSVFTFVKRKVYANVL